MLSLAKNIYRIIYKISPSFASICAGIYVSITGWRFDDLKKYIFSHKQREQNFFSYNHTLNTIDNLSNSSNRLAFVSPLPPQNTGIASCTYYTFKNSEDDIDIFTFPDSDEDFLFMKSRLGKPVHLMHSSLLLYASEMLNYKKIIISLGNSYHHSYLHDLMKKIEYFDFQDKCILYIHDPYINNFIQEGLGLSNNEYIKILNSIYKLDNKTTSEMLTFHTKWELHDYLSMKNISGIKWLYKNGFVNYIVNSSAAKDIILNEISGDKISIEKIFHPVFAPKDIRIHNNLDQLDRIISKVSGPILGTFGLPGFGKCTDIVIEAVNKLREEIPNVRLIVAGYEVDSFFRKNPDLMREFIITYDSPSDTILNMLMERIDIAIQLRLKNLGESSGIIPQLLALNKKVICSNIGSFLEYKSSVTYFHGNSSKELSETIRNTYHSSNSKSILDYCLGKGPSDFRQKLIDLYLQ